MLRLNNLKSTKRHGCNTPIPHTLHGSLAGQLSFWNFTLNPLVLRYWEGNIPFCLFFDTKVVLKALPNSVTFADQASMNGQYISESDALE
jgi:hypothetical protein